MAYKDMLDSFLRKKNSVTSNYGLDFPLMDAKTYDMANKVSNNVTSGPLSYRKPTTFENLMNLGTMGAQAAGAYAGLKTQGTLQANLDLLTEEKKYLSQEQAKKSNFAMLGGLEGQQFRDRQNSVNRGSQTILGQDTATTLDRFGAKTFDPSALKAKL
jgi:hypothetical protein